jgi:hypothetical protein
MNEDEDRGSSAGAWNKVVMLILGNFVAWMNYVMNRIKGLRSLQLEKMIQANDAADNTSQIRDLKHSMLIHGDVATLLNLKRDYARLAKTNPEQFDMMCVNRCTFLFNNYTDIFNKVIRNEINFEILGKLLYVLKRYDFNCDCI